MKKILVVLSLSAALLLAAGCNKTASTSKKNYKLAMIPKGATHDFWKSVHAGALKASQDFAAQGIEVSINWKGPLREDDREQQIQAVEGFLSQGIDGILLAPLDSRALARPVEEARQAGIPTVVFDSALESNDIVSFVATDNTRGGELAAGAMGKLLGGKGKVLLLRYQEGSASTEEREGGFVKKLKADYPGIELISSNQFAGATRDTAKRTSENLLNRYAEEVQGIFTPNESSTAGMLLALQDIHRAGKVVFVGFDSSPTFVDAMHNGQMQAIVVQNPYRMGELSVKTMVDHLMGKPVEKKVDTGVTLIDTKNVDSPEIQQLLHAPVA